MTYWGDHMGAGAWIFSILGTLIIVALIVGVIVWVVQNTGSRGQAADSGASATSAREILDRRLASGEITIEQYEQLRETIDRPAQGVAGTGPPRPAADASA